MNLLQERMPGYSHWTNEKLCKGIDFMDDESNLGNLPFAILHGQDILAKWRDEIRTAADEGEEMAKNGQGMPTLRCNQVLAICENKEAESF
jgi:hypothetical protein